jgi:anaerobic ribonucleoside-triphosphate reductase
MTTEPKQSAMDVEEIMVPTLVTHGGCCSYCGYEMSGFQWANHGACPKCGERHTNNRADPGP